MAGTPAPTWLSQAIEQAGGSVSFERFMALALHDPRHGYYARRISNVGPRGDFATAPTLSPLWARAVAAWLVDCRGPRDIIEIGAGDGSLAAGILESLPWHRRWRIRYHIVETSEPLAALQRKRLGRSARWHPDMRAALEACGGRATIVHNELVDAFPVSRWRRGNDRWMELGVTLRDGCLREVPLVFGEPPTVAADWPLADGQIIESHASYRDWLAEWRIHWTAGAMLTIDYGAAGPELYHRRPRGTLRGYLLHQRVEGDGIYANPGLQDLTADVNFADLLRWNDALGIQNSRLLSLSEFLASHVKDPAGRRLADPAGAGGAFRVLEQHPGRFPVADSPG